MDQAIEALFDLCEDEDVSVSFLLNQYIILFSQVVPLARQNMKKKNICK